MLKAASLLHELNIYELKNRRTSAGENLIIQGKCQNEQSIRDCQTPGKNIRKPRMRKYSRPKKLGYNIKYQ